MPGSPSNSTRDWAQLWDRAAAETAGVPPFEAVYTGPAWLVDTPVESRGTKAWKIAVLERRAGRGAEHWGHLFLVLGENAPEVVILPEAGWQGDPQRPGMETLPPPPGAPFQIRLRPHRAETADRLRAFALEFQRHAVVLAAG
jgi:hypothetical protein